MGGGGVRIRFLGASGEVTGSSYLVETGRARVLVDCGLYQGGPHEEAKNRRRPEFEAGKLDAVVLTHAHLDHAGRVPMLRRWGYGGAVYATPGTVDLCGIMLPDSAQVQLMQSQGLSRRRMRAGRGAVSPLYDRSDVDRALERLQAVPYGELKDVAPGVSVRFVDAGHILGSASVEMRVKVGSDGDGAGSRVIVFSGDIGVKGGPILRDPVTFEGADLVVMESTYGDRDHRSYADSVEELRGVVRSAKTPDGRVIVPAFAVGRTQNLLYEFARWFRSDPDAVPRVFVDSPLATEATKLYRRHRECFDEESWKLIERDPFGPMSFPSLKFTRSAEESMALNTEGNGLVIIAGSGMMNGGRVVHHLKHGLWKEQSHLVIAGYQAKGTLGRRIVDGAKVVRVLGQPVAVKAHVHTIGGFSAHADQSGLLEWASSWEGSRPRVVLTHGEVGPRKGLADAMRHRYGLKCELPKEGDEIVL